MSHCWHFCPLYMYGDNALWITDDFGNLVKVSFTQGRVYSRNFD